MQPQRGDPPGVRRQLAGLPRPRDAQCEALRIQNHADPAPLSRPTSCLLVLLLLIIPHRVWGRTPLPVPPTPPVFSEAPAPVPNPDQHAPHTEDTKPHIKWG